VSRLPLFLFFLTVLTSSPATAEILVSGDSTSPRVTVREQNVLAMDILREIASRTNRTLQTSTALPGGDILAVVDLRDRPLDEVIEILAGASGFVAEVRPDSLRISPEPVAPEPKHLRLRALTAHARGILAYPRSTGVIGARIAMANLYVRLARPADAVDELLNARNDLAKMLPTTNDPKLISSVREIALCLGRCYAKIEQWDRVISNLTRLADSADCEVDLLLLLGHAHVALEHPAVARRYLLLTVRSGSIEQRSEAELLLAHLDRKEKKEAEAIAHLKAAGSSMRPEVGGTALLQLADMLQARNRPDLAANYLATFEANFPKDDRTSTAALKIVDLVAGPINDPLKAVTLLEKALEKYPGCLDSSTAARKVARLWAKIGLVDRAEQRLEAELTLMADDDPARATLLIELSTILEDALRPARARVVYRRLRFLKGHETSARLRAARCLLKVALDTETARGQREELLRCKIEIEAIGRQGLSKEDDDLRTDVLVRCHRALGDAKAAERAMEEALR
jgi:tetratricopeptide (TPR) repeat protein